MAAEYKINPQVSEVTIGTRNLRTIKIYPLSVGDQIELTNEIADSISVYLNDSKVMGALLDPDVDLTEEQIGSLILFTSNLLKDNLVKILKFVVEDGDEAFTKNTIKDMTNAQAIELVDLIIDINFGENLKNAKRLFGKMKSLFITEKMESTESSPLFANDMDTDSEISSNLSEGAD